MRLSQSRRLVRTALRSAAMDALESRLLFDAFVGENITTSISPVLANVSDPSANAITLDTHFTDPNIPGTLATFYTTYGVIKVALTDAATPATVANFLSYVNSGAYDNTIFHRTAILNASTGTTAPGVAADIIQGGGYVVTNGNFDHIPTSAPVNDEYTTEIYNDSSGTLAMAKTTSADSATSEWYFNVHDNQSALDTPANDSNGVLTSYTVFGKVYTGMTVVDEIAGLPEYDLDATLPTADATGITSMPVTGLTFGEAEKHYPITVNNLVYTDKITTTPGTAYTVTSSDDSLVTPQITNGVLSFAYASGKFGTATITVNAKNLDGTSAASTFTVTVPDSATPSAGPTAVAYTAPNVTIGTTATFSVLAPDSDSTTALDPTTVTITTAPTNGTATVDSTTGQISYTPTAGYTGADTVSYTVADIAGTVSSPAVVTLNVVAAPVTVTLGNATARSLVFTQPNGTVGHLTIGGGAAVVTFASSDVTVTKSHGIATASGTGATIQSIVITNRGSTATLTATGATILGSITDTGRLAFINAATATITGTLTLGSIGRITAAAASGATLLLGSGNSTIIDIPNVVNTTVTDSGSIASINSKQWLATDGGYYGILTPRINQLKVSGAFDNALTLSSAASSLSLAKVGVVSGIWTLSGSIGTASIATPASTWSLAANGSIGKLAIAGNLGANNISAGSIGSLSVTGTTTGATLTTTGAFSTRHLQINSLRFGGAVTQSTINANGSIGTITAPSMDTNTLDLATLGTLNVNGTANAVTIDTSATSTLIHDLISHVKIKNAFTNSTITTSGNVGSITAAGMATNTLTALTIGSLSVSGITAGSTIQTTSSAVKDGSCHFGGAVNSTTITASANIGTLTAASLSSTTLTVSSIGSLSVTGATTSATLTTNSSAVEDNRLRFGGAVTGTTLSAAGDVGTLMAASMANNTMTVASLGTLSVSGATSESTITSTVSTSRIGNVRFGGAVTNTKVAAAGAIGSVTAPSLAGSQIFAGVSSAVTSVPTLATSATDLATDVKIGSVRTASFSNSLISADLVGPLHLGTVTTANSSVSFGVSAHKIEEVEAKLSTGGTIAAGPAQLKSASTLSAYETGKGLSLGDFVITLF